MTGIVLCGGKSSRMGTNKAFLEVEGERLIDRVVRVLGRHFAEVVLVTRTPIDYQDIDAVIVRDMIPEAGVLGGIYTGLFFSSAENAFVAACDMPFLDDRFIDHMIRRAENYDIVVPMTREGFQPLHAIYSRRCLPEMLRMLERGTLKVSELFNRRHTLVIREDEINKFGAAGNLFLNINTPDDLTGLS
ncbi:MAG: molybdenum cofactor guanylyltransferase [Syntrophobacterales bacterium]|nr:molybdenum cofactor guanylyltransferase [Syntrophobacterales bacterium]